MKNNKRFHFSHLAHLLLLCILSVLLFSSCSPRQAVTGTWKLVSGRFSFLYNSFDACAIEFCSNGEYIVYDGRYYQNVYRRGSYTYNGEQLCFVVDDIFDFTVNCTIKGNQLHMVTSDGSSRFTKVNTNDAIPPFDETMLSDLHILEGYEIKSITLESSTSHSRTYMSQISQSYPYMDIDILRQHVFEYSPISQCWYVSRSSDININECWNINGVWKRKRYDKYDTLVLHHFTTTEADIEYTNYWGDYSYSGVIDVISSTSWRDGQQYTSYRIILPIAGRTYDIISLNRYDGVVEYTYVD